MDDETEPSPARAAVEAPPPPFSRAMRLLIEVAREAALYRYHDDLLARAGQIWIEGLHGRKFYPEARFMRVLQDGISFGKWPGMEPPRPVEGGETIPPMLA